MRSVAERMGVGDTFHPTPVGVFLGEPGVGVPDPYFGGAGPDRTGCLHCGECMTGCRHGAKNTLVKNYLYLAEQAGAKVLPLTTVTAVRPSAPRRLPGRDRNAPAPGCAEAAGLRGRSGDLRGGGARHPAAAAPDAPVRPTCRRLSPQLGALTRTNSESILGASVPARSARRRRLDLTDGVAITSSFHPDPRTHIEPVRYGKGSNVMGLLQTVLTDGGPRRRRRWLATLVRHPLTAVRGRSRCAAGRERTVIALVMQSLDNSLTVSMRRSWYGRRRLVASLGHGAPNPSWIPAGNEAVRLLARGARRRCRAGRSARSSTPP